MAEIRRGEFRVLAVSPSVRGVGFAILDGGTALADWGIKNVAGGDGKNGRTLAKIGELIAYSQPDLLVLEDALSEGSFRSPRVRMLFKGIVGLARKSGVRTEAYSRDALMDALAIPIGARTNQTVAEFAARRFPDELGTQLPSKRRPWQTENYQMAMFAAVAMALAARGDF